MVDLKRLQKEVMKNKLEKGFNTTDVALEFCRAHEELSEAFSRFNKNEPKVAEEFADVAIFLLGMCEILGFDLEKDDSQRRFGTLERSRKNTRRNG